LGRKHKFWEDKGRGLTVVTVMAKEQKLGTTKELENILWQKSKFNFFMARKEFAQFKSIEDYNDKPYRKYYSERKA
jgi:hypothetical protein